MHGRRSNTGDIASTNVCIVTFIVSAIPRTITNILTNKDTVVGKRTNPHRETAGEAQDSADVSALMAQIQQNPELCRKLLQSLTLGAQQHA